MASHKPDEESIGALFARLVEDAKRYARAELGYYRTLAAERLGDVRNGLIAGTVALVLGFSAIIALLVGLVLALAPLVGPLGATAIVVGVALAIVGLCVRAAIGAFRQAFRPRAGGE